MARPVLRLKSSRPPEAPSCPQCDGWLLYQIQTNGMHCIKCDYQGDVIEDVPRETEMHPYPKSWVKGQLLNVRRNGDTFIITLLNEEFDPSQPERAMHFTNSYECQEFVSWFYNRDSHDPRAG